jgi:hypothetical protein
VKTDIRHLRIGLAMLCVAALAQAQNPPARRPGLWEVRQGPAGMPLTTPPVHVCMSETEAKGDFRGLNSARATPSKCDYQRLSTSGTEVRYRNVCKGQGDAVTMEGRAYDIKPESFKVDMKMQGMGDAGTLHAEARWVKDACPATK